MPETELIPVYDPIDQMTILLFDPFADLAGPLAIEEPLGMLGVADHCFVQSRANILFRKIEVQRLGYGFSGLSDTAHCVFDL